MESSYAIIQGQPVEELPVDLYIPPEALRVFLEIFEGPLDFLSYLIRKQNLDILTVNVARIAEQYSAYIEMMKSIHFELAADYLAMAAWLTELKSRFLLPRPKFDSEDTEQDPRAELIQRILNYEQIRSGAEALDQLPRLERDNFIGSVKPITCQQIDVPLPDVSKVELILAFTQVLKRASLYEHHAIRAEPLSTRERMTIILDQVRQLSPGQYLKFNSLFNQQEGTAGIVINLLAILELLAESCIELAQNEPFGEIYVKSSNYVH